MNDLPRANILVVDDEEFNRNMVTASLVGENHQVTTAENGQVAWDALQNPGSQFDVIVLDRMMPVMGGMELLGKIKAHPNHKFTPVIMQTAKADKEDIAEGLEAGAYYYLTKPYDQSTLKAILNTALRDREQYKNLLNTVSKAEHCFQLLKSAEFRFRTIQEARDIASILSNAYNDPGRITIGLAELLINSVEHGNLGISYDEKSRLLEEQRWAEEVALRLNLPEFQDRYATVIVDRSDNEIRFTIEDQGNGFNIAAFTQSNPARAFDNHGRGILMAKALSFDQVEYQGKGNIVVATLFNKAAVS